MNNLRQQVVGAVWYCTVTEQPPQAQHVREFVGVPQVADHPVQAFFIKGIQS